MMPRTNFIFFAILLVSTVTDHVDARPVLTSHHGEKVAQAEVRHHDDSNHDDSNHDDSNHDDSNQDEQPPIQVLPDWMIAKEVAIATATTVVVTLVLAAMAASRIHEAIKARKQPVFPDLESQLFDNSSPPPIPARKRGPKPRVKEQSSIRDQTRTETANSRDPEELQPAQRKEESCVLDMTVGSEINSEKASSGKNRNVRSRHPIYEMNYPPSAFELCCLGIIPKKTHVARFLWSL